MRLRDELERTLDVVRNGILKLQADIEARTQNLALLDQHELPAQES